MRTQALILPLLSGSVSNNMRTGVERMFSRMKGQRCLNRLRQRGLAKVTTHVYLSALSMVATGLAFGINGERLQFAA